MDTSMLQINADKAANLLKSLANPSRLLVLCALGDREHTAGELEELAGLSQSAVSQHLAKLRSQEIVKTRRDGQRIYYSLNDSNTKRLLETMHEIYCSDLA